MAGLGETLQQARYARGVSLDEAERATHIARRFLEALENEDFDVFSSPVFARGFLRNYSLYLGLDPGETLAAWTGSQTEPEPVDAGPPESARDDFELRTRPLREESRARAPLRRAVDDTPGPLTRRLQPRVEPTPTTHIAVIGAILAVVLAVVVFGASRLAGRSNASTVSPPAASGSNAPSGQPAATRQPPGRSAGSMPNLVGQPTTDAVRQLTAKGVTPLVIGLVSTNRTDKPGTVISQVPAAGQAISTNSNVVLTEAISAAATSTAPAPTGSPIRTRTPTPAPTNRR